MEAVAKVLPFRTNNYITDNLINWNNIPEQGQTCCEGNIIKSKPGGLKNIRIGTKALSYWPYRFTEDKDSEGFHLTIMAHFTHPVEMNTSTCPWKRHMRYFAVQSAGFLA